MARRRFAPGILDTALTWPIVAAFGLVPLFAHIVATERPLDLQFLIQDGKIDMIFFGISLGVLAFDDCHQIQGLARVQHDAYRRAAIVAQWNVLLLVAFLAIICGIYIEKPRESLSDLAAVSTFIFIGWMLVLAIFMRILAIAVYMAWVDDHRQEKKAREGRK